MVMSCSAYGCSNRFDKNKNVSFHSFPKDHSDLKKWLIAIRRESFIPGTSAKLCSQHFRADDFVVNFGKKSLKPNTVPSIFNFPKHLEKKTGKLRSQRLCTANMANAVEEQDTSSPSRSSGVGSQCSMDVSQETASKNANVPLQSNQTKSLLRGRKRNVPVYMGDTEPADLENPKKLKLMWQIANKTIINQRKTIKHLHYIYVLKMSMNVLVKFLKTL